MLVKTLLVKIDLNFTFGRLIVFDCSLFYNDHDGMYNYARMRRFGKGTLINKSNALIYFKLQQTKELMKQYD